MDEDPKSGPQLFVGDEGQSPESRECTAESQRVRCPDTRERSTASTTGRQAEPSGRMERQGGSDGPVPLVQ